MKRLFIATRIELNEPFLAWRTRFQHEMRHDDIVWVKEEMVSSPFTVLLSEAG